MKSEDKTGQQRGRGGRERERWGGGGEGGGEREGETVGQTDTEKDRVMYYTDGWVYYTLVMLRASSNLKSRKAKG